MLETNMTIIKQLYPNKIKKKKNKGWLSDDILSE